MESIDKECVNRGKMSGRQAYQFHIGRFTVLGALGHEPGRTVAEDLESMWRTTKCTACDSKDCPYHTNN